jgi:hypothetical protein
MKRIESGPLSVNGKDGVAPTVSDADSLHDLSHESPISSHLNPYVVQPSWVTIVIPRGYATTLACKRPVGSR